jgi:hypothetical protein
MRKFKNVYVILSAIALISVLVWGCSKDNPVTPPSPVRTFSGLTQRDEFGDTIKVGDSLLIDPEDWVILTMPVGAVISETSGPTVIPKGMRVVQRETTSFGITFGAFPNPFIPGTGRLLINLFLPDTMHLEMYIVNESGTDSIVKAYGTYPGIADYIFPWDGTDGQGNTLPDGAYRVFLKAGTAHSYGDVEIMLSNPPDPPENVSYISAAQFYNFGDYLDWEWRIAGIYGQDGQMGGSDRYEGLFPQWSALPFEQRFAYLPVHFNYDLYAAKAYQYYYLLAYKNYQLGAGWPESGIYGQSDTTLAAFQYENVWHDNYVTAFENAP